MDQIDDLLEDAIDLVAEAELAQPAERLLKQSRSC
jgi:hypothetical protein